MVRILTLTDGLSNELKLKYVVFYRDNVTFHVCRLISARVSVWVKNAVTAIGGRVGQYVNAPWIKSLQTATKMRCCSYEYND